MAVNQNWSRWFLASIRDSLVVGWADFESIPIYVESATKEYANEYVEIRTNGPVYMPYPGNQYRLELDVNLLIHLAHDHLTTQRMSHLTGKVASLFVKSIGIYRYGTPGDNSQLGCAQLEGQIVTNDFGQKDLKSTIQQSTVEGLYALTL